MIKPPVFRSEIIVSFVGVIDRSNGNIVTFPFEDILEELRTVIISDFCDYLTKLCISHTCKKYCDFITPKWIYADKSKRLHEALQGCGTIGSMDLMEYIISIEEEVLKPQQVILAALRANQVAFLKRFSITWTQSAFDFSNSSLDITIRLLEVGRAVGESDSNEIYDILQKLTVQRDWFLGLSIGAAYAGRLDSLKAHRSNIDCFGSTDSVQIACAAFSAKQFHIVEWLVTADFLRVGNYGNQEITDFDFGDMPLSVKFAKEDFLGFLNFVNTKGITIEEAKLQDLVKWAADDCGDNTELFALIESKYKFFSKSNPTELFSFLFRGDRPGTYRAFISFLNILRNPSVVDSETLYLYLYDAAFNFSEAYLSPVPLRYLQRKFQLKRKKQFERPVKNEPVSCILLELIHELIRRGYKDTGTISQSFASIPVHPRTPEKSALLNSARKLLNELSNSAIKTEVALL